MLTTKLQKVNSPQGHGKLIKDPVQVHNRYGHLDDSEEESL